MKGFIDCETVLYIVTWSVHMLTHEEIVKAVAKAATQFSLEKVSYFGYIC